jgi:hypothetical protein
MPFDADKEAVKITTMAADLMSMDARNMPQDHDASCPLMNEWHSLTADQRNDTWTALQKQMPSEVQKSDPKTGHVQAPEKSDTGVIGPIVTGSLRVNGDAFALTFHGADDKKVSVLDFSDRGVAQSSALALRQDGNQMHLPAWCETGRDGN